jgi:hypothetical protein
VQVRQTLTSFIAVLTLFTACNRDGSSIPATPTPADATAEVTPNKATFTIPVEQRSVWRWNLQSSPPNAFEYDWSISQEGVRSFGLSLWKKGNAPLRQGSLSELIGAGQGSIWEPTPEGGGRLVGTIGVTAVRQDSAVELVLSDQTILKELLEKRPPKVEVVTQTLDTTKQEYSIAKQRYFVTVKYPER